jgi:hypothetical protein
MLVYMPLVVTFLVSVYICSKLNNQNILLSDVTIESK